MIELPTLTPGQFSLVYNMLSLAIASMLGSFAFFVLARSQVTAKYRPALVMSALVVGIAGYHYFRIFESWDAAYALEGGMYVATGEPFNDAYRYVDWLLTVPLLVAELVAVLALPKGQRGGLMTKLVIATVLMIGTGYPGEVTDDTTMRAVWGTISTVPFCYILYVLFVELGKASADQPEYVQVLLRNTRLLLLFTWGFYPISYMLPLFSTGLSAMTVVGLQVGYSIADITAKCGYGVMIYNIAVAKMEAAGEVVADGLVASPAAK
ncbi:MAG: bacteriorhodopsin-like [Myxococcota bacterium]